MELNFLFMDDCHGNEKKLKTTSLTGLIVSVDMYPQLRTQFYNLMKWSINPETNVINLDPPELHGSKMLLNETDERKIDTYQKIVNLAIDNKLKIYRIGYHRDKKYNPWKLPFGNKGSEHETEFLGMCFFSLLSVMQPEFEEAILIPVMDTVDAGKVKTFSGLIKNLDIMRETGLEHSMSIKNSENILGEVFYADSKYSVLTQVVDIISYLRHVMDMHEVGLKKSPFQQSLVQISNQLSPSIVHEKIIRLNLR
jgi:hypothetical protein